MNITPNAITILCYGDSNTYGKRPDGTNDRHAADVRWTGQLQKHLGDGYHIIEEGLSSRPQTNLEFSKKPGRNGRSYLAPCLHSHTPIDLVILMLGTNDLKIEFNRPANDIASAIGELVNDIKEHTINEQRNIPRILLLSPIHIDTTQPLFERLYRGELNQESAPRNPRHWPKSWNRLQPNITAVSSMPAL